MFASSDYNNIDHPINRSLLGTCALTLLFLIMSLVLFGPFIALLIPALIIGTIIRFLIKIFFCYSFCNSQSSNINNIYYSPDSLLVAEETRWLECNSKIIILMVMDKIDILKLQSLISSRLILARKNEVVQMDSNQTPTLPSNNTSDHHRTYNRLLYPKFSQRISLSNVGWKWKYDENFVIENHVHNWEHSVSISILTNPNKLSDLIAHINNEPLNLDHPPWDAYLVSMNDCYSQANEKISQEYVSNRSLLVFRLHPSLSDGVSLVHVLSASLSDEQCAIELKSRFNSSGKFINSIRALFIGPVVFIQKWLLTRRDINTFHPLNIKAVSDNSSSKIFNDFTSPSECKPGIDDHGSIKSSIYKKEEKLFHFCTYPLATISRIKGITRSTLTEIFLAVVAGALRTYQQEISKVQHPYDLLCLLPADLSKEKYTSNQIRNSSSIVSKASSQSNMPDISQHITNNYTLVDFGLPTNTEGMMPRLWEVKQRMEELKNNADCLILCGFSRILNLICPEKVGRHIMNTYYNKNSLSISSLQGPNNNLTIGGQRIYNIVYWFPSFCDIALSMSCFSYGDSFICSVTGDSSNLPRIEVIMDAVVYQLDLLNKLLEHRRIPGEHKSQRYTLAGGNDQNVKISVGKFDKNEREIINRSLSPSISTNHLYIRLSNIQSQLQNDKDLSAEDLDTLRSEFSNLIGVLRRRKSCGIGTNGEMADFDEDIEELSSSKVTSRRSSVQGLVALSTRRRSLASSLTRPLSSTNRPRSNSKPTSNYLLSTSLSSSKRASLRFSDDIETGLGFDHYNNKLGSRLSKHDKCKIERSIEISDYPRTSIGHESSPFTVTAQCKAITETESTISKIFREDMV